MTVKGEIQRICQEEKKKKSKSDVDDNDESALTSDSCHSETAARTKLHPRNHIHISFCDDSKNVETEAVIIWPALPSSQKTQFKPSAAAPPLR